MGIHVESRHIKHFSTTVRCVMFATLAMPTSLLAAETLEQVKARFVGHYELVTYMVFPASGGERDNNYVGRIMYDEFNNMSAIGMPRSAPEEAEQAGEPGSQGFSYWGKVSWDLERGVVIHHVEGSSSRNSWVGEDNIRYFELVGDDVLKLSLKDSQGRTTATLTWRKISAP